MTTIATHAMESYIASQIQAQNSVVFDEIIFANIPNFNASRLTPTMAMPSSAQIVHRQSINQSGFINNNAVVYSVTMGTEVGDFEFNFVGLINRQRNLLAVGVYTDPIRKIRNRNGVQGNSLTRSILVEFSGAREHTNITIPAQTWQIDFTVRLAGLDEKIRLTNRDLYGRSVFFGDGFKVVRGQGQNYTITAGAGYIEGIRAETITKNLTVRTLPCSLYVDICHKNTVTGAYQTEIEFLQQPKADWQGRDGFWHYVEKIAEINAQGIVTDCRNLGGFIPNSKKSSSVTSSSNDTVATSTAVKTAYDKGVEAKTAADNANSNANTKVPIHGDCEMTGTKTFTYQLRIKSSDRNSDKYLRFGQNEVDSFIQNPYSGKYLQLRNNGKLQYDGKDVFVKGLQNPSWSDVENTPTTLEEYGITDFKVKNLSTENLNEVMTAGIYGQPANENATASRNYPEQQAGTLLVTNSAYGIQQEYTSYASHRKYVRGRSGETWQAWERIDGIDKVNRSGDTMTGILEIDTPNAIVRGRRNGELGWYVGFQNSQLPDLYLGSYIHSTRLALRSNKIEANKELFVDSNKVHHTGDRYVTVSANNGEYAGLDVVRTGSAGNWRSRIEPLPDKRWKFWTEGSHNLFLPAKEGTVVLDSDFPTRTTSIATSTNHSASGQPYYSGWTRLPNGLLLQWGTGTSGGGYSRKLNFPIAFNEVYTVVSSEISGGEKNFDRDVIWSKTQVWTAHAYQLSYLAIGR